MYRIGHKGTEAPEYPDHSRRVEKCIVRRMEQYSSEADQFIKDLHAEENKAATSGDRGAQQILINSADFQLHLWWHLPKHFNY